MRYFSRLLLELQSLVQKSKPGDTLIPPRLLSTLQIGGKRVSYFQMGMNLNRPPIVLIHGFGGFFMDWPMVMAPLANRHPVYALDLPGWGFSEAREQIEGIQDDVEVVQEFIRQLDLKNVVLVGISYGAAVTWAAAATDASRLKKIVLLNPMPPFPLKHLGSWIYKGVFFLNSTLTSARWVGKFLNRTQYKMICRENVKHHHLLDNLYLELGYLVLKQPLLHKNLHHHSKKAKTIDWKLWESKIRDIQIPVTILQGLDDRVFSMKSAKYLHSLIPHAKFIEVADCGHAMVFDQHRKIAAYLLRKID